MAHRRKDLPNPLGVERGIYELGNFLGLAELIVRLWLNQSLRIRPEFHASPATRFAGAHKLGFLRKA